MPVLKNRVYITTATTGAGIITLGSPILGYQSFADAGVSDGDTVRYTIEDGVNFEIGEGVYTASGTTLSRTPSESSNSGSAINLSGGARVFITPTADDIQQPPSEGPFVDGDKTKLDGIEASADVTDAGNVNPLVDTHLNTGTATSNQLLSWTGSDYDWVDSPSPELYAENYNGTSTLPSATGTNAVAIGPAATASGSSSFAVQDATASGISSIAMGGNSVASGTSSMALSYGTDATGDFSTAVGRNAQARASSANAFGRDAWSQGSQATAIGDAYASGADSFAAAIANNTSSYGATGANSVAIGYQAKATAQYAVSMGRDGTASGTHSTILGGYGNTANANHSHVIGGFLSTTDSKQYATVIGPYAKAKAENSFTFGSTALGTGVGNVQKSMYPLFADTTDATATVLTTNNSTAGSSNQVKVGSNFAVAFSGLIVAREQASGGTDCAAWEVKGLLVQASANSTVTLVNSAITVIDNTPGWTIALSADTTNGCLSITGTGAASTNIRWLATIETADLNYS